jgi:predicted tellurium resistance membrane protein TerC
VEGIADPQAWIALATLTALEIVLGIVIAAAVMMIAARPIGDFVGRHPALKMLALSFLILIGVTLVAEGLDFHIPKGYIYFSMAFYVFVQILNMKVRIRRIRVPS